MGTAWIRLAAGALLLLVLVRPRPSDVPRSEVVPLLLLGVVTAVMTVAFLVALDHIQLGTTVAIEFLGPLTVAALRANTRRMLVWPALALVGVLLLTEPWQGSVDLVGVAAAAVAAVGWGAYILLTQHVGDHVEGVKGLALTIPVAALVALPFGGPAVAAAATPMIVLAGFGLAILLPVLPFALEMLALRRLTATAFGTLMALEPGLALLIGAVLLHQIPMLPQFAGVALVIAAGVGAERSGHREDPSPPLESGVAPG